MSATKHKIRRAWLGTSLTILIGVSAVFSIDRLEAHADQKRAGQLLLAQIEIAASRQALEALNVLAMGIASREAGRHSLDLALGGATEEIDEHGEIGSARLEKLRRLEAHSDSTVDVAAAFTRLQTEIAIALTQLRQGDRDAAYIYGVRRIKPTFEVIEDTMADVSAHLEEDADRAHLLAQTGGATTLMVALGLLLGLRRRMNRERRGFEAQLEHEALHDPLTDLPNRRLFQDRVERACSHRARGHGTALMLVDLDGFKEVNDLNGHDSGDRLLAAVAERLRGCVRSNDTVARIGGDEFAIVVSDVHRPVEVVGVADRIMDSLARPFDLGARTACIGASIGIAIQDLGESPEELCARADTAMYAAKRSGRGAYCIAPGAQATSETPILGRFLVTA